MANELLERREFLRYTSYALLGTAVGVSAGVGGTLIRLDREIAERCRRTEKLPQEELVIGELKPFMSLEAFREDLEKSNAKVIVRDSSGREIIGNDSGVEVFNIDGENLHAKLGITISKELFLDHNSLQIFLHRMEGAASETEFTYVRRTAPWIQDASNSQATNEKGDGSVSFMVGSDNELSSRFSNCLTTYGEGKLDSVHIVLQQEYGVLGYDKITGKMVIKNDEDSVTNIEINDLDISLPNTPYPDSSQSSFFEGEVSA